MRKDKIPSNKNDKKQNTVTIGKAIFNEHMTSSTIAKLITKPVKTKLLKKCWNLANSKFKNQKWDQIFQFMIESNCEYIIFCNNKMSVPLLKQIQHVKFNKLIHVWLTHLEMTNIELIPSIFQGQTSFLMISMNKIRCVKALNKTNFNKLQTLSLGDNLYHQYCVERMNFAENMEFFQLDCWQYLEFVTKYDISFMAKLKPHSINRIEIDKEYKYRIRQDKVFNQLINRFHHKKQI